MTTPASRIATSGRDEDQWTESPKHQCLAFDWSVRSDDPAIVRHVSWLYDACAVSGQARHQFMVRRDSPGTVAVYRDNVALVRNAVPALAVARLVWEVNQGVVADTDTHLLLHAAAAERDGSVVVLPGPSGSGKSTLVAALVDRGMRYVTDEAVAIARSDLTIDPYPKPIALDRNTPVSRRLSSPATPVLETGAEQRLTPPQAFRPDAVAPRGGIARVILFVKYRPDRPTECRPVSRAEAAMTLAENSFNFRRLGVGALALVGEVVAGSRCYRLDVDDLDAACRQVAELLEGTLP